MSVHIVVYHFFCPYMDTSNQTENVYVTELRSLLKDKFFMLLLGISVAIVILSTFYSLVRPKTNEGQVASGVQTSAVETSPTIAPTQIITESPVPTPTQGADDSSGIAGLETLTNEVSGPAPSAGTTSLFGKIQEKIQSMFRSPSVATTEQVTPTEEAPSVVTASPPQASPTPPTGLRQGQTYTVQEGDTLWALAENVYSSGYNFVDIATSNGIANPDYIQVGQKISIPTVQPKQATVGDITSQAAMTKAESSISPTHTVVQGECLWLIAQKEYNNAYQWTRIVQLNPPITNPDFIMPGQVLRLK